MRPSPSWSSSSAELRANPAGCADCGRRRRSPRPEFALLMVSLNAPHLTWVEVPLARMLRDATGLNVSIANDGACVCTAEHQFGAGRDSTHIVLLYAGYGGIGGGAVIDGRLLHGSTGYAGEFGHVQITSDKDVDFSMEGFIQPLPRLSASADLTLVGKSHVLNGKAYGGKETSGELRALKVDMGQGMYAELSGPFSIDAEGWVSGSLVLYVENLDLWEKTLLTGFPEASGTISGMSEMLRGLTKGRDKVSVNLSIDKGTIMLSLIPIGHIPQI